MAYYQLHVSKKHTLQPDCKCCHLLTMAAAIHVSKSFAASRDLVDKIHVLNSFNYTVPAAQIKYL